MLKTFERVRSGTVVVAAATIFVVSSATAASAAVVYTPLIASDASVSARLGTSVAVSYDGSTTVVGGPTRNNTALNGAVYVYYRNPAHRQRDPQ